MKITNRQMVNFLNTSGSILELKIPKKLYSAVAMNCVGMEDAAKVYEEMRQEILDSHVKKDEDGRYIKNGTGYAFVNREAYEEEMEELLEIEQDLSLQQVDEALFERMDEMEKFDSLSGFQYSAIDFMVRKEN